MDNDKSIPINKPETMSGDSNTVDNPDIEKEIDTEMGKNPDRWSGKVDPTDKRYVVTLSKAKNITAAEVLKELVQAHREVNVNKKKINFSSDIADLDDSFEMIRNIFLKIESAANAALIDAYNANTNEENKLKSEIISLKSQIDALELSNKENKEIRDKQAVEIKGLKQELNDKKADIKKVSSEFDDNEKALLNYRRWLENAESRTKELEGQVLKLTPMASKNVQVEEELHNKNRLLRDAESEISTLKKGLETARAEVEQKKVTIDELKTITALKDTERERAVFEETKELQIKIGILQAQLKYEQEKNEKRVENPKQPEAKE